MMRRRAARDTPSTSVPAKPGDGWAQLRPLTKCDEVPEWYAQYACRFVTGGYRRCDVRSARACAHSVFGWHNETLNIWTHAAPAVICLGLAVWSAVSAPPSERGCVALFACSALGYAASATFHTLNCHSRAVARAAVRADMVGISSRSAARTTVTSYWDNICDLFGPFPPPPKCRVLWHIYLFLANIWPNVVKFMRL